MTGIAGALLGFLASGSAPHHDTDSYAHLVLGGAQVELALELDTDSLMAEIEAPPPLGADWEPADVEPLLARAADWVAEQWQLELEGERVALEPRGCELLRAFDPMVQSERNLRVVLKYAFAAPPRDAAGTLVQRIFEGRELAHRHSLLLERAGANGAEAALLLDEWRTVRGRPFHFTLPDCAPGATGRRTLTAVAQGARAIVGAPWLALFLLALAWAPLPRLSNLASLAAAAGAVALAFFAVRAEWIAPAAWAAQASAALAVGYVAAENLFARELKLRAATAALFGVVHGMAVASLAPTLRPTGDLAATGLPPAAFCAGALAVALATGALGVALESRLRTLPATRRVLALLLIAGSIVGVFLAVSGRPR